MAHAVHPNYADKHEPRHLPKLNQGPVIKVNANARYATDAETSARFQGLCEMVEVPYQKFVMRADMLTTHVTPRGGFFVEHDANPLYYMPTLERVANAYLPEVEFTRTELTGQVIDQLRTVVKQGCDDLCLRHRTEHVAARGPRI